MKRCSCCHKLKPETAFWKNRYSKDGLQNNCKDCHYAMARGYYKAHIIRNRMENSVEVGGCKKDEYNVSGIKISILNHTKRFENIFNIQNLNTGEIFKTDNKEFFFKKLEKMLGRVN